MATYDPEDGSAHEQISQTYPCTEPEGAHDNASALVLPTPVDTAVKDLQDKAKSFSDSLCSIDLPKELKFNHTRGQAAISKQDQETKSKVHF